MRLALSMLALVIAGVSYPASGRALAPAVGRAEGVSGQSATPSAPPATYVKRRLPAVKTTTPPTIDGDLSDPAWKTAPKAETFVDQQNGSPVADQTTAYVLYDAKYLYIAFACKDSQPDKIEARETVRDSKYQGQGNNGQGNNTEDNVEVIFDPFQGHRFEDRSLFSLNAIGCCSAQLGGGRANKVEWKGDWDGAVKKVADGWTAEMRIPWSALNYPASKQPITMGINFSRFQNRTHLLSMWSNIGPEGFYDRDGQWTGVQVPEGAFHPHLSLLPYFLPGNDRFSPRMHAGLDLRYTLTPQLTAVGSVNPDFATVEGAVQSIQFSRSEQFVPEARPFFLEGRDIFQVTNINIIGNYFYSNRIPGFDLGSKLYGKISPQDTLGFLHTIAFGNRDDMVMRYRHDLSATSQVGLFLAQKSATDDNNTLGVVNQNSRWGKLILDSQWALSSGHLAGGDAKQIAWLYQDKLVLWALGYGEISPLFRDADGYIPFVDYRGFLFLTQWNAEWRKGFWRNFNFNMLPQYAWHWNGKPFQRGANMFLTFEARRDWSIGFNANYDKFDDQTDNTYGITYTQGVSNRFRQWGFAWTAGKQADRPYTFAGPFFSFRLFHHLDLTYAGALQNLDGVTQQHILTMNYELSPTRALGGRLVVQNANTNWYLFYRNSGGRGTNVYFILGDPNALRFVKKVQMKFVFAL